MWQMIWPIGLIVLANCFYNICTKSMPTEANAFLGLSVTYLVATVCSFVMFFISSHGANIVTEIQKTNWTSAVLGIAIVGLEFGYICTYRAGWKMSTASLTANIILACALILIGILLYKESVSVKQVIGFGVCFLGLFLITK